MDPTVDVVDDGSYLLDALAGRVGELPVEVLLAGVYGAGVSAAHRDDHVRGAGPFGVFDVDPGEPGGTTTITFTCCGTTFGSAAYRSLDTITLTRPRPQTRSGR